jgi:hypothetical protein
MTASMKRQRKIKLDPRIYRHAPQDWLVFWLAGPGQQSWDQWRQHYLLSSMAFGPPLLGTEQEDAESRRRILALMENLFSLDQICKRKTSRDLTKIETLRTAINKGLRLYPVGPRVFLQEGNAGWKIGNLPLPVYSGGEVVRVLAQEEHAFTLFKLRCEWAGGWPPQLRRCAICNNWFWGKRSWAKVCASESCKATAKRQYQTSEEYKKHRKDNRKEEIRRSKGWLTNSDARKDKNR